MGCNDKNEIGTFNDTQKDKFGIEWVDKSSSRQLSYESTMKWSRHVSQSGFKANGRNNCERLRRVSLTRAAAQRTVIDLSVKQPRAALYTSL